MPQIMPLNWLILMLLFSLIFMIVNSIIFFLTSPILPKHLSYNYKFSSISWKW
uniref:ATP synthase F0 subunit 8 n=1 Tax=Parapsyche elsis TaxID=177890 RepID=UPI0022379B92|nr:ATP synthase F0 subunit 8 [Parapsyche elsis]UYO79347.1 ATP synthase F0 subunit 8 [Parapsyche elsis]